MTVAQTALVLGVSPEFLSTSHILRILQEMVSYLESSSNIGCIALKILWDRNGSARHLNLRFSSYRARLNYLDLIKLTVS